MGDTCSTESEFARVENSFGARAFHRLLRRFELSRENFNDLCLREKNAHACSRGMFINNQYGMRMTARSPDRRSV